MTIVPTLRRGNDLIPIADLPIMSRILYITYGLPYPPNSGAKVRDYYFIRHLAQHNEVVCCCLLYPSDDPAHVQDLQRMGIDTHAFPQRTSALARINAVARHGLARLPLAAADYYNPDMFAWIREFAESQPLDFVQVEHSFLATYTLALPERLRGRTWLDLHNIAEQQYRRMAELPQGLSRRWIARLKAFLMAGLETQAVALCGRISTVSRLEAEWLLARAPGREITVIENGVDAKACAMLPDEPDSQRVLFVGSMDYLPNVDAVRWFCASILPLVQGEVPGARLDVVGRCPVPEVLALRECPGVAVTGTVEDLRGYYQRARVVVVPLRAGGGTRLKILEAMAYGRAVVSTGMGCEGLEAQHQEHLLMADDPAEFAAGVVALMRDGDRCRQLAETARKFVESKYDWQILGDRLANSVADFMRADLPDYVDLEN